MPIPILATKLFIPPLRPETVARPRLTEAFQAGLHHKMTLVSAPAGFGKSTVVSECIAASERDVAWLSLGESESDLHRFLSYVVATLQKVKAGIGESILTALEAQQPPPADTLLTLLLNDLAVLEEPLILVLDDYHSVEAREVDEALGFLLEHLPPSVHLVIASREDPMLPLARWRACGQLTEIRAADLRFSPEEAAAFLNQTMKLDLSEQDVLALEKRTEGWVAGLQMAALSLQGRDDQGDFIEAFTGSHRFVLDYLAEEVLQRQDAAMREFLLKTSILDRLQGSLCDAVTGQSDGDARLQSLENENLFVVPLDNHRSWYRYHHLFGDVSLARLMQEQKAALPDLHRRASEWYRSNGEPLDAIKHALASEDFEYAASLIEETWPELRKSTPESQFMAWIKALPEASMQSRPVLCAYYGLGLLSLDLELGVRYFDMAEKWLSEARETATAAGMKVSNEEAFAELPGLMAVGRAYQAGAMGDMESIVQHAQRALELLDEKSAVWRGSAAVLLGMVYWGMGDLDAAYGAVTQGHQGLKAGGEIGGAISTLYLLANIRASQGNLREAIRHCEQGQKMAKAYNGPAPQGTADVYVTLAAIKLEQNELDAAQQLLNEARELGEQAVLLESRHLWYFIQARIESCLGHHEVALTLLDEAEEQQIPSPAPSLVQISTWRALLHLKLDQLALVEEWAGSEGLSFEDEPMYMREFEYLVLARLLIAQYRSRNDDSYLQQAQDLLARMLSAATQGKRSQRVMEIHVLQALVFDALGETKSALKAIGSALEIAEARGYVRVFMDEGQPLQDLLKAALKQRVCPELVTKLLSVSTEPSAAGAGAEQGLLEPLSDRELDVLRLLGSELNGPEIASQLFISLNTMRTHTKNIYTKLAVNSRRTAVKRAEELGLL